MYKFMKIYPLDPIRFESYWTFLYELSVKLNWKSWKAIIKYICLDGHIILYIYLLNLYINI